MVRWYVTESGNSFQLVSLPPTSPQSSGSASSLSECKSNEVIPRLKILRSSIRLNSSLSQRSFFLVYKQETGFFTEHLGAECSCEPGLLPPETLLGPGFPWKALGEGLQTTGWAPAPSRAEPVIQNFLACPYTRWALLPELQSKFSPAAVPARGPHLLACKLQFTPQNSVHRPPPVQNLPSPPPLPKETTSVLWVPLTLTPIFIASQHYRSPPAHEAPSDQLRDPSFPRGLSSTRAWWWTHEYPADCTNHTEYKAPAAPDDGGTAAGNPQAACSGSKHCPCSSSCILHVHLDFTSS